MKKHLDACGLACPAPVLLVKDFLDKENPQELSVLVDNEPCRENVTRFLGTRNFMVTVEAEKNGIIRLQARRAGNADEPLQTPAPEHSATASTQTRILILVTSDRLGRGDSQLGEKLMINYIKTLREMGNELWQIIFVNSGVKLTVDTSPVLQELQEYEQSGIVILACGTCLAHFELTESKKVGATTNMLDIITATQLADKVISIG